jgi:hypothetical protein
MVSSNEADFNLREIAALDYTLHKSADEPFCSRAAIRVAEMRFRLCLNLKVDAGHLAYPASVRDTAKSGMGCNDNRHLTFLAESILVNVGGLQQNEKVSSPPMSVVSVGAAIVVRAWESQAQGEGPQSVGISSANCNRLRRNLL